MSAELREWRVKRWHADPRCHWCGVRTILRLGPGVPRRLHATIDHLRTRFDPTREAPARGEVRRVLSCYGCNHARGRADQAAQPIEELWKRSGRAPRAQRGD